MSPHRLPPSERSARVSRVLWQVLVLNLLVAGSKFVAWLASDALSVLAETAHSSLDAGNNVFALWVARVASRAPDADHPYGHDKFETLGALTLVGALSITVFELVQHAILRLVEGTSVRAEATPVALAILALSVAVALAVAWWEARQGRALGSDLLLADAAHTRADVLTTIAALAGLLAVRAGYPLADPVIAVVVAVIIGAAGWQIVRRTIPVLVDEVAVDPDRIRRTAEAHPEVHACYGIRSRGRPGHVFAELTIAVAPDLDVHASHAIADAVEDAVTAEVAAREVVVHVEPVP